MVEMHTAKGEAGNASAVHQVAAVPIEAALSSPVAALRSPAAAAAPLVTHPCHQSTTVDPKTPSTGQREP